MSYIIKIEGNVKSDYSGYAKLINLHEEIISSEEKNIIIDFSKCTFFEANLSAVLGAIVNKFANQGFSVTLEGLSKSIENILLRNNFLKEFGGRHIKDHAGTTLSYKQIAPEDEYLFREYLDDELLSKDDFPRLSTLARKKISTSIFELFENARTHGQCRYVYVCGQYYPNHTPARIDLTIVDLGDTIKKNVNNYLKVDYNGVESIKWAIRDGNTTKTGNLPGGLGLDVIIDFINKNEGKFQIVSSDGFWQNMRNNSISKQFIDSFPGTIANIEFNLDDNKTYISAEENWNDITFL